jgi:hypothetical protein
MDIRNATQFANFVSKGNLVNLDMTFQQVVFCINNYNAACNCWKAEDKKKLYDNCTVTYMNAVKSVVPRFKNEFLSKTEERQIQFYTDNGALIGLVCR